MEKATCDSCGKVVMESSIKDGKCWTCTRGEGIETDASSAVSSQGSNEVGESSQRAIDVLKIVNQINFICGVILALVIFFYFTHSLDNFLRRSGGCRGSGASRCCSLGGKQSFCGNSGRCEGYSGEVRERLITFPVNNTVVRTRLVIAPVWLLTPIHSTYSTCD